MQNWKFVLIGITGDLAKRKILPAIGEFSNLFQDEVQIDLIGYSRSEPNVEEINQALNQKVSSRVRNIILEQGNYDDNKFFINLFNNQKDERVIVYFAVPPHVFLDLLNTFCPFSNKHLDIIIEKPFGQNKNEALLILKKIEECKLGKNIHFCDHYLFKEGIIVNDSLKEIFSRNANQIKLIKVKALEIVDTNGRGGYYEGIGAIKDMIPAHFFSILATLFHALSMDINFDELNVVNVELGQYQGFLEHIQKQESNTETYFKIKLLSQEGVAIEFESGKKLDRKETSIELDFRNGENLYWRIDPNPQIVFGKKIIEQNTTSQSDHTRMLHDILNNKNQLFLSPEDTIEGWILYNKIVDFISKNHPPLNLY